MAPQYSRLRSTTVVCILLLAALLPLSGSRDGAAHLVILAPDADAGSLARTHSGAWRSLSEDIYLVRGVDARTLDSDQDVLSVEPDRLVRAANALWNGAGWDSTSWDTASWDRAAWDTASWDRASWDRASWDRASWDSATTPPTLADPTWGYRAIHATAAGGGAERALVCLVDSGIDAEHAQLSRSLWRDPSGNTGIDLVRGDNEPDDEAGHGTHLAGIIAASTGGPMRGVSEAQLASAKILDATGTGSTSDLILALAWCSRIGADVILLALTEDTPTKALARALHDAKQRGSVIVASAGNVGPCRDCVSYPARDPNVLAIASLRPDLEPSAFSTSGREIDLALPGSKILSTYPGDAWRVGSGTSQAAAYAAGAIAALVAQGFDPASAAKELQQSSSDLAQPGRDAATGHGIPDLARAQGAK